jgi:hypothetical protein
MSHKYGIGARVVTKINKEAKVTELLPPEDGSNIPRYRVKTDIGSAVWPEDHLK